MPAAGKPQRFVILSRHSTPEGRNFLNAAFTSMGTTGGVRAASAARALGDAKVAMRVIDSVHEDGAKLVEMTPEAASKLHQSQPGLKVVPEVFYSPAWVREQVESRVRAASASSTRLMITVTDPGGSPVRGAEVVAFTDYDARAGDQGKTNASGTVSLQISGSAKLERLYVYPERGFWNFCKKNIAKASSAANVKLQPIVLPYTDCVRHMFPGGADGTGVRVGVVDTGVGPHPDLVVSGGENTVEGESPTDYSDNGERHGTHVAGIIASRGSGAMGIRGVAPGVELYAYRVFGSGSQGASNFAIIKAIDRALAAGCDVINMSLGGGPADDALRAAIDDARERGTLCIVANGNDERSPVSFPASYQMSIAVSAMGRKGTFPKGTVAATEVASPYGTDKKNFLATFTNVGPETDLVGPGVGVISTVPGGFADMSGTSMACPAVAGIAARLLGQNNGIRNMPRNSSRRDAFAAALLQSARPLGFGKNNEGSGLPSA